MLQEVVGASVENKVPAKELMGYDLDNGEVLYELGEYARW